MTNRQDPQYIGTIDLGAGWYHVSPGWTEDEILDDIRYLVEHGSSGPRLTLRSERLIREQARAILASEARTVIDDRPIDRLRRALDEWVGEWPPTQRVIAAEVGWKDQRSIYAACSSVRSTWKGEIQTAERRRSRA